MDCDLHFQHRSMDSLARSTKTRTAAVPAALVSVAGILPAAYSRFAFFVIRMTEDMYTPQAYKDMHRERIAELVKKEGFYPLLVTDNPGYIYHQHEHPETKLLVILEGSMQVSVGEQTFECAPGDRLIIPVNTIHSAEVGQNGCTFFWSEKLV